MSVANPPREVIDLEAGAGGLVHVGVFLAKAFMAEVDSCPRREPSLQAMAARIADLKTTAAKSQQAHLLCVSLADLLRGDHVR